MIVAVTDLVPEQLTEVKAVKITSKWVYIYKKSPTVPGKVFVAKIAHTNLEKYKDLLVDPPPGGETSIAHIDISTHSSAHDAAPIAPGWTVTISPDPVTPPSKKKKKKKPEPWQSVVPTPAPVPTPAHGASGGSFLPGTYQHSGVTLKKSDSGLTVNVPFDSEFVADLKEVIPWEKRTWNKATKEWSVDASEEPALLGLLDDHFGFDAEASAYSPSVSGGPAASPIPAPPPPAPTASPAPNPKKKPPPAVGSLPAPTVPSESDLSFVGGGSHLGGAGKKDIYQDSTGHQWIFKHATKKGGGQAKPHAAEAQQAFSQVSRAIKPHQLEVGRVSIGGQDGTLQPLVALGHPSNLGGASPASLTAQEKDDVASEHVLDWLMSQHDSHGNNLLRTADGRIIGVDKEQGHKYFGDDKLSTDYHPNSQYGENPPFYNKFWGAFASGDMDFDPQSVGDAIEKVAAIDTRAFEETMRPYADARFGSDEYEKTKFLRDAMNRKVRLKPDFEKFLTDLYKKREGAPGKFTFEEGWVPDSATGASGPKFKTVTLAGTDLAASAGLTLKDYQDKQGNTDPDIILLRVNASSDGTGALDDFVKEHGLDVLNKKTGSTYHMYFVPRADFDKISVQKKVKIEDIAGVKSHAGPADYFPSVGTHELAIPNVGALKNVHESKDLGQSGMMISMGGKEVEGQTAKIRRVVEENGLEKYVVSFKLRKNAWSKLKAGGEAGNYHFGVGDYSEDADAVKVGSASYKTYDMDTRKWETPSGEVHLSASTSRYAFMGQVTADIRPKPGETVHDALRGLLDQMSPGLSQQVMSEPTPTDRAIQRMSRLLSTVAPQVGDKLTEAKRTVPGLTSALFDAGVSPEEISSVRDVEVRDGHSVAVMPGQWKTLGKTHDGKPALRFLLHAVSNPANIVNALKRTGGLLPVTERIASGIGTGGASWEEDINTGGADNVQVRVMTQSADNSSVHTGSISGSYQYIIAPDEADRLDLAMYAGDTFGATNPQKHSGAWKKRRALAAAVQKQQDSYSGSAEMLIPKGISPRKFVRITTQSNNHRATLIKELRQADIHEVNGVPVEDFVVVSSSVGETYKRYVEPLGY